MNTARRRQQGYRVNKREIQDPLSSFAQNGIKTQGDPPNPLDMLQEDVSPFVRGMKDVSEFNTQYNDMMYALADYQNMLKRREEMTPKSTGSYRLVREEPTSVANRLLKGVAAERYPDVTDFSQLDKFNMVTTGTETGTFDKPKAYKTRQVTGTGDADGVGAGFYQADQATMETDKQRGINLAASIGGAEGDNLRKFYEGIDTSVRMSEQRPEVQEAMFMSHMLEDPKTDVGGILRSGNLSAEEQKKIFEDNWYEGFHRPTRVQRNTPGYKEGRINLYEDYFDKYQSTL